MAEWDTDQADQAMVANFLAPSVTIKTMVLPLVTSNIGSATVQASSPVKLAEDQEILDRSQSAIHVWEKGISPVTAVTMDTFNVTNVMVKDGCPVNFIILLELGSLVSLATFIYENAKRKIYI